jgi:poly-gamma-glutamate synthesis protein (capsule biosynthesis protein)
VAVGDCLIARPMSQAPGLSPLREIIGRADVSFANLESSLLEAGQITVAPAPEFGCGYALAPPEVAQDIKSLGFHLLSRANNHAADFGPDGIRCTGQALDRAGIVHSGAGENRAAAGCPRYFDAGKERVALISAASTFAPLSRSTASAGHFPGRPGVNALRTTRYLLVTPDQLQTIRNISDMQPAPATWPQQGESPNEVELCGVHYRAAKGQGFSYTTHPIDENHLLESVRDAKRKANFVIFSIHAHEPGNWSDQPADFLSKLAHDVIDAGGDAVIGHGPHRLRAVEVYRGRPIFYSLGNFVFHTETTTSFAAEIVEQHTADLGASEAELNALWMAANFRGDIWFQSMVSTCRFKEGQAVDVQLTPLDLSGASQGVGRGTPQLAINSSNRIILEHIRKLSAPFGTQVSIENGVGVVRQRRCIAETRSRREG